MKNAKTLMAEYKPVREKSPPVRVPDQAQQTLAPSGGASDVLELQHLIGNRAVLRLFQNRDVVQPSPAAVPPVVRDVLSASGQPLDQAALRDMEARFNYDFSAVRIHSNDQATTSAAAVDALAYTVGDQVVFGQGQYSPNTGAGRQLLAHELAHVIQQRRGGASPPGASGAPVEMFANRAATAALLNDGPIAVGGSSAPGLARQKKPSAMSEVKEEKVEETPPADTLAGTLVSKIIISLARKRVGFQTALGMILGDVDTDLRSGKYKLRPDVANKKWEILEPATKSGIRFSVKLEGANPWTLSYPDKLDLIVAPGSVAEPKTFGEMLDAEGKLTDPLWVYEGMPAELKPKPIAGLDDFDWTQYDLSYRSDGRNLSNWLRVYYRDNTARDIYLGTITEATPRLWAAKQKALKLMGEYNLLIMMYAFPAVFFILTVSPTVSVPEGGSRYTVSTRRVQKTSGNIPQEPVPKRELAVKEIPRLPEVAATTEENITALINDSNPEFPLTRVNARKALTGPPGATARAAGAGGEGSDVQFRQLTPEGNVVLRREVKCIQGGAQGSFNAEVSHAARQVKLNGEILVQIPEGGDALRLVLRFRGARTPAELGMYRSVKITIVDPTGNVLFNGPLAP